MLDVNALRAEFVRNGMTQAEVAKHLGMSAKTLSLKLKHGSFGIDEADKLIKLLGIESPAQIFFGSK